MCIAARPDEIVENIAKPFESTLVGNARHTQHQIFGNLDADPRCQAGRRHPDRIGTTDFSQVFDPAKPLHARP